MANLEHLDILRQGVDVWNAWRQANPDSIPDLSLANLEGTDLEGANLSGANLQGTNLHLAELQGAELQGVDFRGANLAQANLYEANLLGANLSGADLHVAYLAECNLQIAKLLEANLDKAILRGADLQGANLSGANLYKANLQGTNLSYTALNRADLQETDLTGADLNQTSLQQCSLVETTVEQANLTGCTIYGLSVWNLKGKPRDQSSLVITRDDEPTITVDDLEVAQFIYLLLNNQKIRNVIDTVTSKAVLILGRFTDERKPVLDALRNELRQRDYLPILFDFEQPSTRDITQTVSTLAHMARFIIADITDAKSIPQELMHIVPTLPSVAVRPLILRGAPEYAMFSFFRNFPWVLPIYEYEDTAHLLNSLTDHIIIPAEAKVRELAPPPSIQP